jgi:hypothetical protein
MMPFPRKGRWQSCDEDLPRISQISRFRLQLCHRLSRKNGGCYGILCGVSWACAAHSIVRWRCSPGVGQVIADPANPWDLPIQLIHDKRYQHAQITKKQSFTWQQFIPRGVGGAHSQKPFLKNGTVENVSNGGDAFSTSKLPKFSPLFHNNLSPGIGGAPSQKPYLKNGTVEIFFLMVVLCSPWSNYPKSVVYLTTIYPPV